MKKQALLLTAVLTAAVLSGCSTTDNNENGNQNNHTTGTVMENVAPNHGNAQQNTGGNQNTTTGNDGNETADSSLQMGLGIVSRLKRAQNAGDTDGSAEINTTVRQ